MKRLFILTLASFFMISCGKSQKSDNTPDNIEPTGFREFKIDDNKTALKISLFGVYMGTPDYVSVWEVIESAQDNGLIDHIVQLGIPFEGGVDHCIEISNNTNRQQIIDDLKQAPTSVKDSYYTVESISDCSQ